MAEPETPQETQQRIAIATERIADQMEVLNEKIEALTSEMWDGFDERIKMFAALSICASVQDPGSAAIGGLSGLTERTIKEMEKLFENEHGDWASF